MARKILLETCESTNDVAMDLARKGCEHNTVVITKQQTRGRGRLGRVWESFEGNLAMSLVIRPNLSLAAAYRLVSLSAYAVLLTLQKRGVDAYVKWPNDILIKDPCGQRVAKLGPFRKIGGILLEVMSTGQQLDAAIIGIGLNLKKPPEASAALIPQMGFVELSRDEITDSLLKVLVEFVALADDDAAFTRVLTELKAKSAFLDRPVQVDCGNRIVCGVMKDLLPDGGLLIQAPDGAEERVYVGDLSLL